MKKTTTPIRLNKEEILALKTIIAIVEHENWKVEDALKIIKNLLIRINKNEK